MKPRQLNRLKDYDYTWPGRYFVTICTEGKAERFGVIENSKMILNPLGDIVSQYWTEIPQHYSDILLDEWVVMPNHIHGIIIIVGAAHRAALNDITMPGAAAVDRTPKSLSSVIKSFKDVTTKQIRTKTHVSRFAWQRSFHDHIIRDESSLKKIREYIKNNPAQWDVDVENVARRTTNPPVIDRNYV